MTKSISKSNTVKTQAKLNRVVRGWVMKLKNVTDGENVQLLRCLSDSGPMQSYRTKYRRISLLTSGVYSARRWGIGSCIHVSRLLNALMKKAIYSSQRYRFDTFLTDTHNWLDWTCEYVNFFSDHVDVVHLWGDAETGPRQCPLAKTVTSSASSSTSWVM